MGSTAVKRVAKLRLCWPPPSWINKRLFAFFSGVSGGSVRAGVHR